MKALGAPSLCAGMMVVESIVRVQVTESPLNEWNWSCTTSTALHYTLYMVVYAVSAQPATD